MLYIRLSSVGNFEMLIKKGAMKAVSHSLTLQNSVNTVFPKIKIIEGFFR